MSRMKSLTSFLAMALVVSMVSFAHAQSASTTTSSAADAAKKTTGTASKDAHAAAGTASKDAKSTASTASKDTKAAAGTATTETKKAAGETKKEAAAKASDMAKYDLNSATKDELMKIPGIGAATADKIVAGRPWKQKSDLVSKGIMNKAMYEKASPYMIAKQATAKK